MDLNSECPNCGSKDIAGLIPAFWVGVKEWFENPTQDISSDTEMSEKRMCHDCEHEWNDGDE